MPAKAVTYYDSDQLHRPLVTELVHFWEYRSLIKLLVVRDLTVRYKRSALGVWWTLLNPLLTTAVLWVIFSNIFRFEIEDAPFIVYLLSGILLVTYFSQGVISAGSAIVNSASVLSKVYVPPEVFSLSAATAAAVNFLIGVIPLLIIQTVVTFQGAENATGIPWTVVLVPIPVLAMLALVAGLGLLVASAAVYFYDVLDLTAILAQLVSYLAPTFYPLAIVPQHFRVFIMANPIFSYLEVFRGFVYRGEFAPAWMFVVMFGTAIGTLALGVWVFSRSWKKLVVLL